jgi:hypothetical protein
MRSSCWLLSTSSIFSLRSSERVLPSISLDLDQDNGSIFVESDQITTASSSVNDLLAYDQQGFRFFKYKLNILSQELFDVTFSKAEIREGHVFNFIFTERQAIGKVDWNKHFCAPSGGKLIKRLRLNHLARFVSN